MKRSNTYLFNESTLVMGGGGSIDSMNKTLKSNRNSRPSKRKERHKWKNKNFNDVGLYNHYEVKFKELPPEELEILKQKIREESKRWQRRTLITFGLLLSVSFLLIMLLFV